MDDATDLTPAQRRLDPDERGVAEQLRRALDGRPAGPGPLLAIEHRAAARHRRRLAQRGGVAAVAVAGVAALVASPLSLQAAPSEAPAAPGAWAAPGGDSAPQPPDGAGATPPAAPDDAVAAPSPSPPDTGPLLTPDLVGFFIPAAAVVDEPGPVTTTQDPSGAPTGGLCGDAVLTGVLPPAESWGGAWEQQGPGAVERDTISLRETVLTWDDAPPEAAASYVESTRASATGCGGPQDSPPGPVSFRLFGFDVPAGEVEVIAAAPVPGSELAWRARAVGAGAGRDGRRDTVVDLDLVILAPTADDAAWIADGVLTVALTHATSDGSPPAEAMGGPVP